MVENCWDYFFKMTLSYSARKLSNAVPEAKVREEPKPQSVMEPEP